MEISYHLPDEIVHIINAYSKPVTRPDWRTLRIMPNITFRGEYYLIYLKRRDKLNAANYEEYRHLIIFYKPQFSAWNYERLFANKSL
jgi:hypothetical protein